MNKESSHIHEWIPLPSGISISPHQSFTEELLKHFDKKCSIIFDGEDNIDPPRSRSLSCSVHSSNTSSSSSTSSRNNQYRHSTYVDKVSKGDHVNLEPQGSRRRSAANLLRKSSLYLRTKFHDHKDQQGSLFHSLSLRRKKKPDLAKVAINTTINTPQPNNIILSRQQDPIQPPIITQYPPKPLQYSPVEPLPDDAYRSKKLHRLSLPLLKFTAVQQYNNNNQHVERRRSDSDLLEQQQKQRQQPQSSKLESLWNKLIYSCRKKK